MIKILALRARTQRTEIAHPDPRRIASHPVRLQPIGAGQQFTSRGVSLHAQP